MVLTNQRETRLRLRCGRARWEGVYDLAGAGKVEWSALARRGCGGAEVAEDPPSVLGFGFRHLSASGFTCGDPLSASIMSSELDPTHE